MTRIKICGLTRREDALTAAELGVNALGVILVPESPRCVSLEKAREILEDLSPEICTVGVLRNPSREFLEEVLESKLFSALQFHGEESPEMLREVPCITLKALGIAGTEDLEKARVYENAGDFLLLDSRRGSRSGGTGESFDWNLLGEISFSRPFFLAGGLKKENLREALERVNPWGVDLNSGAESAPGIKDREKMRDLVKMVREYHAREE
ncbi:MAG TPA: phosphoribosylanthranilate isomerase [Synergistaceae bacterium]|nr:phosphoribosylanthranilate isomerase [Synergistaceae bacterium]HPQ37584.1 phosphoribosylanthranilate isomerase [Synergistaceae bacterium]